MRRPRSLLLSPLFAAAPLFAAIVSTGGCSQAAYADQIAQPPGSIAPRIALAVSPAKLRAPYDVQVIREGGETLPTYAHRDRFYVQGNAGERYVIRITNPTANRIEAVVSVDGLDVVDGEAGDLRKRGYVVPPYGETRIEGFRTSQADVATFRFSSVSNSYAGKKGKARNVGVIAVALFEEQAPEPEQQIIVGGGYRAPHDDGGDYYDDESVASGPRGVTSADRAPAKAGRGEATKRSIAPSSEPSARRPAAPPAAGGAPRHFDADEAPPPMESRDTRRERPGLGTEFGESRSSAASFTRFVRAPGRPVAIAELRYNDASGLLALGIPVTPLPDAGELMTRETADPVPGDSRFATPPR